RPEWLRLSDFQIQAVVERDGEEICRSALVPVPKVASGPIDLGTLRPATGPLVKVRVVDLFGAQCPWATLKVFSADGELVARFQVSSRGELKTRELPVGEYLVIAAVGDFYGRKPLKIDVISGQNSNELLLPLSRSVRQSDGFASGEQESPAPAF